MIGSRLKMRIIKDISRRKDQLNMNLILGICVKLHPHK